MGANVVVDAGDGLADEVVLCVVAGEAQVVSANKDEDGIDGAEVVSEFVMSCNVERR